HPSAVELPFWPLEGGAFSFMDRSFPWKKKEPLRAQRFLSSCLLFFCLGKVWLLHCHDGVFLHRDTAVTVVTELNDYGVVHHVDDHSVEPAGRENAVAGLHAGMHGSCFLLLLLLRTDHHKVNDCSE